MQSQFAHFIWVKWLLQVQYLCGKITKQFILNKMSVA